MDQRHSLRFEDSTSQAHYYEADWDDDVEYYGVYPIEREDAYYDALVKKDWAYRMAQDVLNLKAPVEINLFACQMDITRNDIPF